MLRRLRLTLNSLKRKTSRIVLFFAGLVGASLGIWGLILRYPLGYRWADWTGFEGKTAWEWMELLVVPVTLALTVYWLDKQDRKTDREIARERREDEILRNYFDQISELVFERGLMDLLPKEEEVEINPVVKVAKAKSVLVLRQLDCERREMVFRFLKDTGLYKHMLFKVDLQNANLRGAQLYDADLRETNLSRADLSCAQLRRANLTRAHLPLADLSHANFSGARLQKAYLYKANLEGAFLKGADLEGATLEEANLAGADLRHASLNKANLRRAALLGAKLDEASMDGADLAGAIMPGGGLHR